MLRAYPQADVISQRDGYPNGAGFSFRGRGVLPHFQMTGVVNVGFIFVRSTASMRQLFTKVNNASTMNDQHLFNRLLSARGVRFETSSYNIPFVEETLKSTDGGDVQVVLLPMTAARRCDVDTCGLCIDPNHACCDTASPFDKDFVATTGMRTPQSALSVRGTIVFHCFTARKHDARLEQVKTFGLWTLRDDWVSVPQDRGSSFSAWLTASTNSTPHLHRDGTGRISRHVSAVSQYEHTQFHQPLPPTVSCLPLSFEFEGEGRISSSTKFCTTPAVQAKATFVEEHHERLVSWITLHPQKASGVYLDIGANAGIFSTLAKSTLSKFSTVYSLEPQPVCADNLLYTKQQNRGTHWHIWNVAVGREAGRIKVPARSCGMGWEANEKAQVWGVDVMPLSKVVRHANGRSTLRSDAPFFIKIDVDGAEVDIIEAALELFPRGGSGLLKHVPEMYVEVNTQNWKRYGVSYQRAIRAFETLALHYTQTYLLSALPVTCEGHLKTLPTLTTLHRSIGRGEYRGQSVAQKILKISDFGALLRGCVLIEQNTKRGGDGQLNVWFVP